MIPLRSKISSIFFCQYFDSDEVIFHLLVIWVEHEISLYNSIYLRKLTINFYEWSEWLHAHKFHMYQGVYHSRYRFINLKNIRFLRIPPIFFETFVVEAFSHSGCVVFSILQDRKNFCVQFFPKININKLYFRWNEPA